MMTLNKRRGLDVDEQDIALETSQLLIRSPSDYHNKRARYEPSWTLDTLCSHPCSPLANIDLEVCYSCIWNCS